MGKAAKGKSVKTKSGKVANRRVKFAEPLAHQRHFDKTQSPNAEPERVVAISNGHENAIESLDPPYSLVAHLDMAANKLHARPKATQSNASNGGTLKETVKSVSPGSPGGIVKSKRDSTKSTGSEGQ